MKTKLAYRVINGPSLLDVQRSLLRNSDNHVFEVEFTWNDNRLRGASIVSVLIQGLERPRLKGNLWKIRAACGDISKRSIDEINTVLLYNPSTRKGFLDFVHSQPSLLVSK